MVKRSFVKKLRGLNPQEVDQYLDELEKKYAEDIENLKRQVRESEEEKERLYERLAELQEQRVRKTENREIMELALLRAKEAAEYLREKAEEERRRVKQEAETLNENNRKKIRDIEEEINKTKEHIKSLLDSMLDVFQSNNAKEMVKHFSEKIIQIQLWQEERKITADGTAVPDLSKRLTKNEDKQQMNKMLDKLAKVLNPAEKENIMEQPDIEQKQEPDEKVSEYNREQEINRQPAQKDIVAEAAGTGFWGDGLSMEKEVSATGEVGPSSDELPPDIYTEQVEQVVPQETKITSGEVAPETLSEDESTTQKTQKSKTTQVGMPVASPTVSQEINNIRFKYITGKIAGEDLFDYRGGLIIAKGNTITPEVVARAEAEGKLPELIVNMILPGMED